MGIVAARTAINLALTELEHVVDGPSTTPPPPPIPTGSGTQRIEWTPFIGATGGVSGQRYHYQTGYLLKDGPFIQWWAYLQFSQLGTMSGVIRLEGFPLATATVPGFFGGSCSYSSNLSPTANDITAIDVWTSGVRKDWNLYGRRMGANPRPLTAEDINAATQLILHGSYFTD